MHNALTSSHLILSTILQDRSYCFYFRVRQWTTGSLSNLPEIKELVRAMSGVGSTMLLLKACVLLACTSANFFTYKTRGLGKLISSPPPLKWRGYHKCLNVSSSKSQFKSDRHSTLCKCMPEILMLMEYFLMEILHF